MHSGKSRGEKRTKTNLFRWLAFYMGEPNINIYNMPIFLKLESSKSHGEKQAGPGR